jgi:transcriptional antiterminator RfaH
VVLPWLVATSENGKQATARNFLEGQGFEVYFPRFRERRFYRGHKQFVESYLFGRYFFVLFVPIWYLVRSTFGVDAVFVQDDRPALLHDGVIEEIKAREDRDGVITIRKGFRRGQRVRIKHGPLAGMIGTFDRMTTRDREVAFVSMLGQLTRIELAAGSLAIAA